MHADQQNRRTEERPAIPPAGLLLAEIQRLKDELARAEVRITELETRADVDPLVDILNRRGFERELSRSLAYVRRYDTTAALLFIDLDGFKAINDRHGHAAGDAVLKAVAAALRNNVRASDLVGRLGGDEFAVLMWHLDAERAVAKSADLENMIAALRVDYGAEVLTVGASAGAVALVPDATTAAIVDAADKAMYARKKARRG